MAITSQTLALLSGRRTDLDQILADLDLALISAWAMAWDELAAEFDAALTELMTSAKNGRVTGSQAAKNIRLRKALSLAADRLDELAQMADVTAKAEVMRTALAAAQSQIDVAVSQMPTDHRVSVMPTWTRVSDSAMDAIVARTAQNITTGLLPLSDDAVAMMKRNLIRGIAIGDNPRKVARNMVRQAEKGFNGGLTRAMTIARTEMLDAHRAATKAADEANTDLMAGWLWGASLDARTCPSCLAQHGKLHPVDEEGPIDHHQGRCDRIPKTKSWRELGFNLDEPDDLLPDSREWFDGLTADTQARIMGRDRLELLNSGTIGWDDLSTKVSTDGWRDAMHVTPVRDLRALAG
ncbi:phage minor head protein [Arthrobacter luteolus]|uniref:phage minor head protein n=1 Tax=Arthrobacter luteolus TaxID=98672 RepID=UPI00082E5097|nr:phage minor head protein [Arthrobacter luteolus]